MSDVTAQSVKGMKGVSGASSVTSVSDGTGATEIAPRVVVVGAGPAGVRAAQVLVQAGLRPVVVDEGRRDGGQIYRRQPEGFTRPYAKLYGSEAHKAQALHRDFDALRAQVDYRSDTLAWNLGEGALHVVHAGQPQVLPFDALIVCAGATDRLMPVPGWQRAGCYSLGASQIALKAQACAIGARVVFWAAVRCCTWSHRSTCRPGRTWRRCSTRHPRPSHGVPWPDCLHGRGWPCVD
jgi:threonine dehydrogenase-like Zn-dependent dehydrogenase